MKISNTFMRNIITSALKGVRKKTVLPGLEKSSDGDAGPWKKH